MAIYSFDSSVIRRSQGNSALRVAAYYRGIRMHEERTGKITPWTDAVEVVYSNIVSDDNAPQWVQKLISCQSFNGHAVSESLWNKVSKMEKRKDSQEAYKHFFALPNEMRLNQLISLADEVAKMIASYGTVVDYSIHCKQGNYGMHMLETMRYLNQDGFGFKNASLSKGVNFISGKASQNSRLWLIREQASAITNKHLICCGIKACIDHRTLFEQNNPLRSPIRVGSSSCQAAEQGVLTERFLKNEQIKKNNFELLTENPDFIISELANKLDDFTYPDIVKKIMKYIPIKNNSFKLDKKTINRSLEVEMNKFIQDFFKKSHEKKDLIENLNRSINISETIASKIANILILLQESKKMIYLGVDENGLNRYTTISRFKQENLMMERVLKLANTKNYLVKDKIVNNAISKSAKTKKNNKKFRLNEEQKFSIKYLTSGYQLRCLACQNSENKKELLSLCTTIWRMHGFTTILSSAVGLSISAFSEYGFNKCLTINDLLLKIKNSDTNILDDKTVLIVNDASIINNQDLGAIIKACSNFKSKLILIGNLSELCEGKGSASFKTIIESIGVSLSSDAIFQQKKWQRRASAMFAMGNISDGLESYYGKGNIKFSADDKSTKDKLLNDWMNSQEAIEKKIIFAHDIKDVNELNSRVRYEMLDSRYLKNNIQLELGIEKDDKLFLTNLAINERVMLKKGSRLYDEYLTSNKIATVSEIKTDNSNILRGIVFKLDDSSHEVFVGSQDIISGDVKFLYAYALLINDCDGFRFNESYFYCGNILDSSEMYLIMTMHIVDACLYVSNLKFSDFNSLVTGLSKKIPKDIELNYPIKFALSRGLKIEDFVSDTLGTNMTMQIDKDVISPKRDNVGEFVVQNKKIITKNSKFSDVNKYVNAKQDFANEWSEFTKYAEDNDYYNHIDSRVEIFRMGDLSIYKQLKKNFFFVHELSELVFSSLDKYETDLRSIDEYKDFLHRRKSYSNLLNIVYKYKQARDKLYNAKAIVENIQASPAFLIKLEDIKLDQGILNKCAREYEKQTYLKKLKGKELEHFKLIGKYDEVCKSLEETRNVYQRFYENIDKEQLPEQMDSEHFYLNSICSSESNSMTMKQNLLKQEKICQSLAYKIQEEAIDSIGLSFYRFDNEKLIVRLKSKYELENSKEGNPKVKILLSIKKNLDFLIDKQQQIAAHSLGYECFINIIKYKKEPTSKLAASIRATLKSCSNIIYSLAREHEINWNNLLNRAEEFDKNKIYQGLDNQQKICFDRVEKYLSLDRKLQDIKYEKHLSDPNVTRDKLFLANQILSELSEHKKALEFYHFADNIDENGKFTQYEIENFNKLKKDHLDFSLQNNK